MPELYFAIAAFFFLFGLILAWFSFITRRPPLLFGGGVVWLVLGLMALTGQAIQLQNGVITNYTYANWTLNGNITPVLQYTNTTSSLVPLNNGNTDPFALGTAGLFGFTLIFLGIYLMFLAFLESRNPVKDD